GRATAGSSALSRARTARARTPRCLLAVQRLSRFVLRRRELIERALNFGGVRTLDRLFRGFDCRLDGGLIGGTELAAGVLAHALGGVDRLVGAIPRLDLFPALLVFVSVRLGFPHHAFDLVLAEAARRRDGDLLFLAGAEILRLHVDDAVRVDVE